MTKLALAEDAQELAHDVLHVHGRQEHAALPVREDDGSRLLGGVTPSLVGGASALGVGKEAAPVHEFLRGVLAAKAPDVGRAFLEPRLLALKASLGRLVLFPGVRVSEVGHGLQSAGWKP